MRPSKKLKLDNADHVIFDDPTLQRRASDICRSGSAESGFLSAKVFMSWAPAPGSTRLQTILETVEMTDYGAQSTHRFFAVFTGACSQFFANLALQPRDEISLSLKGAQVEKMDKPLRSCTLEMKLVYAEGVVLMHRKRVSGLDAGKIVDTFELSQDWFASPEPEGNSLRVQELDQDDLLTEDVPMTKKEMRRRNKAKRAQGKAIAVESPSENPEPGSFETVDHEPTEIPPAEADNEVRSAESTDGCDIKAGLQTATHKYHPIGEISLGQEANIIGVVVNAPSAARTRTGEWCINIKMVDPSSPGGASLEAFAVNCFTKRDFIWLPQPTMGDVLMLRRVQIHQVQGHLKGTGYHNRFHWAIYSPEHKRVHHGELSNSQNHRAQTNEDGSWTPFFDVAPPELDHCVKLSAWFHEQHKKQGQEVQQIGSTQTPVSYEKMGGVKRLHRLIKDAGPEVPPNGYFDCTVEVIHGYINNNEVYSLFVTDYTKNDLVTPSQIDLCPDGLADYILKMEMWDAAAKVGPTMEAGSYYLISNARMRVSRGGYVEAKVVLPRITRLNEEDAARIPHLKDLLERKETWNNQYGTSLEIEDKLIEDAIEDEFFNCNVEVLHVTDNGYSLPSIYVTDYTEHSCLEESKFDGEWFRGLEGRVAKISLWDCHTAITKSITPGFYYSIKKLRFKMNTRGYCFEGELRGRERLIYQLNPRQPSDELQRLIQRKERFLQRLDTKKTQETSPSSNGKQKSSVTSESSSPSSRPNHVQSPINSEEHSPRPSPTPQPQVSSSGSEATSNRDSVLYPSTAKRYTSLKEVIHNETCPNKFLVRARAIDFYPFSLKDCSQQWCTQCEKRIPTKFKACVECVDTEHEYITYRYQVFIMLEDDAGTTVVVSVYDKSHLFDGLERANFCENTEAYNKFCARISPLLGILVEVHENSRLIDTETEPQTEAHELEIVSWDGPDGKRAFGLYRCSSTYEA